MRSTNVIVVDGAVFGWIVVCIRRFGSAVGVIESWCSIYQTYCICCRNKSDFTRVVAMHLLDTGDKDYNDATGRGHNDEDNQKYWENGFA